MHIKLPENLKTLIEVLKNTVKGYPDKIFLKHKIDNIYYSITYQEFYNKVEAFTASLMQFDVKKNENIAIVSENMHKWLIADYSVMSLGAKDVPRGSDSTAQELLYILRHADIRISFVEGPEQADKLLSIIKDLPKLKIFIMFSGNMKDIKTRIPEGLKIYFFDDLLKKGFELVEKYRSQIEKLQNEVKEDDVVTIIYTSGTTGTPKGVMLTHKNIMHNIRVLPEIIHIYSQERWLSILPVWHVFERTIEYIIISTFGLMCYSKPTAKHLLPDFAEIKPTFMVAVPRVYEALYQGIVSKVKNGPKIKQILFNFFIKIGTIYKKCFKILAGLEPLFERENIFKMIYKKTYSLLGVIFLMSLYMLGDILVYKKIREKTGGCLRGPISGGGALPEFVDKFFSAINLEILEGWGLTETAPVIGVRIFERLVPKTVGAAAPEVQIRICGDNGVMLPNQHEKGIVYIKGPNVMKGYYKEPEKTKAVISDDGWFNTGDLGRLTLKGDLQLTGRAKDTIVLTGGENIEPGPIEDKLLEHPLIHQVMVVGQDKKVIGALIVPHEENLIEFAQKHSINFNTLEDICNDTTVLEEYRKICKSKINMKNGFKDYERIVPIALLKDPFQVGVEITHSLKLKRNFILDKYISTIEKMFR
ncbi:MAG: long-chain fatty acid--CoA ligase [Spirochaetes bacterium]|nr:long-chain fatty acid--CoA ligase [Spirochaetota bacterium]